MTTFIKAKLKKSDDQKNIDKFRVAANIKKNVFPKNHHSKILYDNAIIII